VAVLSDDLNLKIQLGLELDKTSVATAEAQIRKIRKEAEEALKFKFKSGDLGMGEYNAMLKQVRDGYKAIRSEQIGIAREVNNAMKNTIDGARLVAEELGFGKSAIKNKRIAVGQFDTGSSAEAIKRKTDIGNAYEDQAKQIASGITGAFLDEFSNFNMDDELQHSLQDLNDYAAKIGKMLGLTIEKNVSEVTGQPDFVRPENLDPGRMDKKQASDFIQAKDITYISPAMLIQAFEKVNKENPTASWPSEMPKVLGQIFKQSGLDQGPSKYFNPADDKKVEQFQKNLNEVSAAFISKLNAAGVPDAKNKTGELARGVIGAGLGQTADRIMETLRSTAAAVIRPELKKAAAQDPQFNANGYYGSAEFENMRRYVIEKVQEAADEIERAMGLASGSISTFLNEVNSAKHGVPNASLSDSMAVITNADIASMVAGRGVPGIQIPNTEDIFAKVFENPNLIGAQTSRNIKSELSKAFEQAFTAQVPFATSKIEDMLAAEEKAKKDHSRNIKTRNREATAVPDDIAAYARMAERSKQTAQVIVPEVQKLEGAFVDISNWPLDKISAYLKNAAQEVRKSGDVFAAAFDTEFNNAIPEQLTEAGIVIKNATGQFVRVAGMVHMPNNPDLLATAPRGMAKNAKDITKIADSLGIAGDKVGVKDASANNAMFAEKVGRLVDVINMMSNLDIPITGHNLSAEKTSLNKALAFIKDSTGMLIDMPQFNSIDALNILKKSNKSNSSANLAMASTGGNSLQNIITNLFKTHPQFMAQYSDVVRPDASGTPKYRTAADKTVNAHIAEVDSVASLIVMEFIQKFGQKASELLISSPVIARAQAAASGGGSIPPRTPATASAAEQPDPSEAARSASLNKLYHSEREFNMLLEGVTTDERTLIQGRINMNSRNTDALARAAQLVELEKKLTVEKDSLTSMRKAGLRTVPSNKAELQPGFIGPSREYANQLRVVAQLEAEQAKLVAAGRQAEVETVRMTLSDQRYSKMKETVTHNTRKQIDAMLDESHTTRGASNVIKQSMRDQELAAKQAQIANKALISSWVTARYALYDVANAQQNVARSMFFASQRIFQMTSAYRSYETAFTSVERAMQLLGPSAISSTDEVSDLKNQFADLATQLPITFEELSQVATLGAQMGVSAQGIKDFTKTVAEFSSITGVGADTVAQSFGRIAELANVDYSKLQNLGSAISYAGVNAVATDSEIMNLSESIAAISEQAGFVPGQIVGMGTALASVGIQSEQARGVFTRVFSKIDRAVSDGGASLANYAKVSGMSAEQFKAAWGTQGASYDVLRSMLGGLKATGNMTAALDKLGLTETRERNTLVRLAENLNVVDQSMSDATSAYDSGIFLSQSFEKTTDNLDAKITLFQNSVKNLSEELSRSLAGSLSGVLDTGTMLSKVFADMSKSTTGRLLAPLALTATVGGSALLGLLSITKKVTAQLYAMRVASLNATSKGSVANQVAELTGLGAVLVEKQKGLANAAADQRGQIDSLSVGVRNYVAGAKEQQKVLLDEQNIYAAIGDKMFMAQNAEKGYADFKKLSASERRDYAVQEARAVESAIVQRSNEVAAIDAAIIAEREAAASKIATASSSNIDASARRELVASINAESAANIANLEAERVRLSTDKIVIATYRGKVQAISAATIAEIENTIATKAAGSAAVVEAQAVKASMVEITASTEAANLTSTKFAGGIGLMFSRAIPWVAAITTAFGILDMVITGVNEASKLDLMSSGGGLASLRDALKQDTLEWQKTGKAASTTQVQYESFTSTTSDARNAIVGLTGTQSTLGTITDNITSSVKSQTIAVGENTKNWILNSIIQNEKVQGWLKENPGMFREAEAALKQYGTSFGAVIQQVLADPKNGAANATSKLKTILGSVTDTYNKANAAFLVKHPQAVAVEALWDPVVAAANAKMVAVKNIIKIVEDAGSDLNAALDNSALMKSLSSAFGIATDDIKAFGNAAAGAAPKVKTLTDWAGELAQKMNAAFGFRFDKQTAYDAITKKWRDMKKAASDAQKAVKKAQDTINGLKADRATMEYQLSIAVKYGDDIRATKLRADLAKNTTDLADAEDTLKTAQDGVSTELKGNSDAAIKNRSDLQGLLNTYIPYIQALNNSTVAGETAAQKKERVAKAIDKVKVAFGAEAEAMGFASGELKTYLDTFDDFKKIETKSAYDVTVNVNGLGPATRALTEFAAAANGAASAASDLAKAPKVDLIQKFNLSNMPSGAQIDKAYAWNQLAVIPGIVEGLKARMEGASSWQQKDSIGKTIRQWYDIQTMLVKKLGIKDNSLIPAHADGGFISGAGTGTSDSILSRLSNGEFVMRASAVSQYGVGFMNALNQERVRYTPASASSAPTAGGSGLVYLSPEDRALLRAAIDRPITLYADGTRLAQSVNDGNRILAQRGVR
jgi:TP901 family phage tail tape measure protein